MYQNMEIKPQTWCISDCKIGFYELLEGAYFRNVNSEAIHLIDPLCGILFSTILLLKLLAGQITQNSLGVRDLPTSTQHIILS